ncbi:MAG TPA: PAS domain S-box protein [Azospirillum sp.]|nr:PAS domain S-box protein [Azospirillum sp.]
MTDRLSDTVPPELSSGILGALDVGVMVLDSHRCVRLWNAWMARATGRPADEAVGRNVLDLFPEVRDSRIDLAVGEALATGAPAVLSHTLNRHLLGLTRPNGQPMVHSTTVRRLDAGTAEDGPLCLVQIADATPASERDRQLRERREARYRAVVDTARDAIITTDVAGTIQWMNRAAERGFGYTTDEAVGHPIALILGEDAARWLTSPGAAAEGACEVTGRRRNGDAVVLELSLARWTVEGSGSITGILRDITERRRVQHELQRALEQKSLLLREVNHRIKNSLHLVSSLLQLQLRGLSDPDLRHHVQDAIGRIQAIAQVHSRLYQTERFETVELATYLEALCDDLVSASGDSAAFRLRVEAEPVELPIDTAVPLGLIANELITNAIKHGGDRPLEVLLSLKRHADRLLFTVSDTGPGLPPDFSLEATRSLGMRIVTTLSRQIGGALEVLPSTRGASFRVAIPLEDTGVPEPAGA